MITIMYTQALAER